MLNQFVEQIRTLAAMLPTQIIGVKNLDYKYIYCSPSFAKILGYSVEEVIGEHGMFLNDPNNTARISEDTAIIQSRKEQSFVHIDRVDGQVSPFTFIKSPIIEPQTQEVIGILCQVFNFSTFNLSQQVLNFHKGVTKQAKTQLPKLSKREKQVIFLFLANLNSSEIVEVIYKLEGKRISKGTIDCVFTDQLFPKFAVYNRPALFQKLLELGYNRLIPFEMLPQQTMLLETQDIY